MGLHEERLVLFLFLPNYCTADENCVCFRIKRTCMVGGCGRRTRTGSHTFLFNKSQWLSKKDSWRRNFASYTTTPSTKHLVLKPHSHWLLHPPTKGCHIKSNRIMEGMLNEMTFICSSLILISLPERINLNWVCLAASSSLTRPGERVAGPGTFNWLALSVPNLTSIGGIGGVWFCAAFGNIEQSSASVLAAGWPSHLFHITARCKTHKSGVPGFCKSQSNIFFASNLLHRVRHMSDSFSLSRLTELCFWPTSVQRVCMAQGTLHYTSDHQQSGEWVRRWPLSGWMDGWAEVAKLQCIMYERGGWLMGKWLMTWNWMNFLLCARHQHPRRVVGTTFTGGGVSSVVSVGAASRCLTKCLPSRWATNYAKSVCAGIDNARSVIWDLFRWVGGWLDVSSLADEWLHWLRVRNMVGLVFWCGHNYVGSVVLL